MKGNWNIAKGKLREKWARVTDDARQFVADTEEELMRRSQERLAEACGNVERALREYEASQAA